MTLLPLLPAFSLLYHSSEDVCFAIAYALL